MASGDLTATEIYVGQVFGPNSNLIGAINGASLAAATDILLVIPIAGRDNTISIVKVERTA